MDSKMITVYNNISHKMPYANNKQCFSEEEA